ncbi:MAG: VOC family protein [Chloroflexi bacterium]|nr:VOC family protein [Chloroflexota bacterium]
MSPTRRPIRGLGEIALRVDNLDAMQRFYADVIRLELMQRFPTSAFFRIAEGFAGHTQILALFDRSTAPGYTGLDPARTTVDHIAFVIALADFAPEQARLEGLGLNVRTAEHAWTQWRSLYVDDLEGNTVELVCYDPSIDPPLAARRVQV